MKFMTEEEICKLEHKFIQDLLLFETTDSDRAMTQMTMYIAGVNHFAQCVIEEIQKDMKVGGRNA